MIAVRRYRPDDLDALIDLFRASVRTLARHDYSDAQVRAWAPDDIDRAVWAERRGAAWTWVAEQDGRLAGFIDLEPDGHIDMLFVAPEAARQGVARALLDRVKAAARAHGLARLYTEASITARPFFESRGFAVTAAQTVTLRDQAFRNFRMESHDLDGPPPTQAAIVFAAENFDIAGSLFGRQSASHGLLAGYLRHGGASAYRCAATSPAEIAAFRQFAERSAPGIAADGVLLAQLGAIADIGTLVRPGPDVGQLAWLRRGYGQRAFSVVGLTHTLSELKAAEAIGNLLTAPVQAWDALVCTSNAGRASVARLLDDYGAYLESRCGAAPAPALQLPVIPLGVDAAAFAPADPAAARARERARLGLADDEVALLYVGRLDHLEKANPLPMYLAAQRAARQTGRRLRLIECGWAPSASLEAAFIELAAAIAPDVPRRVLDGRLPESRGAWFAADIFLSCVDNVQESFGLTPVEAMAAGLPAVVSDWDGYRDTVRDGLDGFRVPTAAPPAGLGEPLALLHAAGCAGHDLFCGAASQSTAVDVDALASALVRLIQDGDLRRRMGEAGRRRARDTFDWRVIVGAYQDLWAELAAIRQRAPEAAPLAPGRPARPLAMDPFTLFAGFASQPLGADVVLTLAPGVTAAAVAAMRRSPVAAPVPGLLLDGAALDGLMARLADGPAPTGRLVAALPEGERHAGWLTLGWFAKAGFAAWSRP